MGVLLQIQKAGGLAAPLTAAKIARGCHFSPRLLSHLTSYGGFRRVAARHIASPGRRVCMARGAQRITLFDIIAGVEETAAGQLRAVCGAARPLQINHLCEQNVERFADDYRRIGLAQLAPKKQPPRSRKPQRKKSP